MSGDHGLGARLTFRGLQAAQVRPGFQNMVSRFSPNAVTDRLHALRRWKTATQPVVFDLKYHAPLWATKTGHLLILNGKDMTNAPFDRASRTFPIYVNQVEARRGRHGHHAARRLHAGRQAR